MSSKSILTILSYTVSNVCTFLRRSVVPLKQKFTEVPVTSRHAQKASWCRQSCTPTIYLPMLYVQRSKFSVTYVPVLLQFFQERDLVVSSEKSSVNLFTPQLNQAREHPQISINGTIVPLEKQPKTLGVTHDTMYTFTPHCSIQAAEVRARNNLLKALISRNILGPTGDTHSHLPSTRQISD